MQAQYLPVNLQHYLRQLNDFVGKLDSYQSENESAYEASVELVMVDGKVNQKALDQNRETAERLKKVIDGERSEFYIYSFKARQL